MKTTAAEQAVLEQTNAALAAGEDPFGDNEGFDTTAAAPDTQQAAIDDVAHRTAAQALAEQAADAGENQNTGDPEVDEETLQAIANGGDTGQALPAVADPLNFSVNAPADYKTARAGLLQEKSEAMGKLMNGEIDASEYAAIESRVMDGLEDLSAQRIRAETLIEVNAQSAAQSQTAVIKSLISRTRSEVAYEKDDKAQRQFDMALGSLSADPDNAGKSFADLADEAHKVVLALRGLTSKPSGKSPEELAAIAAARAPAGRAPTTLRSIPAAATANTGGNITETLARLSGQEYEAAFARLTPAQKAAMLDG